jgi:hypothetical protein
MVGGMGLDLFCFDAWRRMGMRAFVLAGLAWTLGGCVYFDAARIKYALTKPKPELSWQWCHCIPQTAAQWDTCRGGGDLFASQPCRGQLHGRSINPWRK